MANILETLIKASERAACIARACCSDSTHEALFVAEKVNGEANARFDRDFKTIADVLAQESAKTEIAAAFPELADDVRGEECSEIGGVNIAVQDNVERTTELLNYLVPPNAARRMADAVHSTTNLKIENLPNLSEINTSDLGVWIDPIDATAEFIAGAQGKVNADHGLPCVTVLIGAYLKSTGEPVMGVINQPFYNEGQGRIVWGVCYQDTREFGATPSNAVTETNTILMSAVEKPEIAEMIQNMGWDVKSVPGAGHKLLKVALGEAAAYVVSKATTFRWDTCAPHAILRAKGGDVLNYTTKLPITYNDTGSSDTKEFCNSGGIIAYVNPSVYDKIESIFE